jgi:Family of unknown function (DUF5343)
MAEKIEKQILPPYIPYKTFVNFINKLRETGVPNQIDKSVLRGMSGAMQSATIAALKFLNLIDSFAKPTQKLTQLVDASGENYSLALKNVLTESYIFLFESGFKLEQATSTEVENKFKAKGVSGSTITKCIAFFLAASKEANITVSIHVRPPSLARSSTQRKVNIKKKDNTEDNQVGRKQPPPPQTNAHSWHEQLLAKFPEFDPKWEEDTKKAWFEAFNKLMAKGEGT